MLERQALHERFVPPSLDRQRTRTHRSSTANSSKVSIAFETQVITRESCNRSTSDDSCVSSDDVCVSGKRVENISRLLGRVFDEAVWRQPSCVLLDDLDSLCRASSAQQEVMGEATYFSRIAHGKHP